MHVRIQGKRDWVFELLPQGNTNLETSCAGKQKSLLKEFEGIGPQKKGGQTPNEGQLGGRFLETNSDVSKRMIF